LTEFFNNQFCLLNKLSARQKSVHSTDVDNLVCFRALLLLQRSVFEGRSYSLVLKLIVKIMTKNQTQIVVKCEIMISSYEHSDIVHIMRMNRLTLVDSDTAHLWLNSEVKGKNYEITISVTEDLPAIIIKRNGIVVFDDTVRSIDDLKIFLEERLYKYVEV